jgi:hypothetical protein
LGMNFYHYGCNPAAHGNLQCFDLSLPVIS